MSMFKGITWMWALLLLAGCAGVTPPNPVQILQQPLGTSSLRIGMLKEAVREAWGDPNAVTTDQQGREVWVYTARTEIPLNVNYLSKDQRLIFDGNSLVAIKE